MTIQHPSSYKLMHKVLLGLSLVSICVNVLNRFITLPDLIVSYQSNKNTFYLCFSLLVSLLTCSTLQLFINVFWCRPIEILDDFEYLWRIFVQFSAFVPPMFVAFVLGMIVVPDEFMYFFRDSI